MPLNDLSDIIDAINTADQATQIQFAQMVANADVFLQNQLQAQAEAQQQANIDTATTWWTNNVIPQLFNPITSRSEALQNYNDIKNGIETQTDQWRLYVLRQKLEDAENNFKLAKSLEQQNQPVNIAVV